MDKIRKFNNRNLKYDKENKNRLSVFDLLPETISWEFGSKFYNLNNNDKIISKLLANEKLIAIIEAPFNIKHNKAYIVNGNSEVVINVSKLFEEKYGPKTVYFSDIYCIDAKLFYFLSFKNSDFRIEVDIHNFLIGGLIESR